LAVSLLKKNTGKSLVTPVKTRWSSLAMAYIRILEIFDEFADICKKSGWEPLIENDRQLMQLIVKILEPFRELTTRLQSSTYPTISMVYPGINGLIRLWK
jgi:hypothetical protein